MWLSLHYHNFNLQIKDTSLQDLGSVISFTDASYTLHGWDRFSQALEGVSKVTAKL